MHHFSILLGISTGVERAEHLQDPGCVQPVSLQGAGIHFLIPALTYFSSFPAFYRLLWYEPKFADKHSINFLLQAEGRTGTELRTANFKIFWVKAVGI